MQLPSRLARSRHGVYYFRITIPARLRPQFDGKAELRRSLHTRDPREARTIAYALSSAFLNAFRPSRMTQKKPPTAADMLAALPPDSPLLEAIRLHREAQDRLDAIGAVGKIVINLPSGGSLECDTPAEAAAMKDLFNLDSLTMGAAPAARAGEPVPVRTRGGKSFTAMMEEQFADAEAGWTPRTMKSYRQKCENFARFVKNPPIADITREDITRYKRHLRETLSARSVNNYLGAIAGVFEKSVIERVRADNPCVSQGLAFNKDQSSREAFLPDHLHAIFDPVRMTALEDPADYWFPLIGVFTGMRISTIGQLRTIDVFDKEGLPAIHVFKDKTPAGVRTFPMATQLVELGFLDYVAEVRAAGCKRVFPHLNETEQGYGKEVSKRFSALIERLGAKESRSFHSFRHTFNKRISDAGVGLEARKVYVGHKQTSVNAVIYKGTTPFHALAEHVLPGIRFPEIDIGKLRIDQARFRPLLRECGVKEEAEAIALKAEKRKRNPLPRATKTRRA